MITNIYLCSLIFAYVYYCLLVFPCIMYVLKLQVRVVSNSLCNRIKKPAAVPVADEDHDTQYRAIVSAGLQTVYFNDVSSLFYVDKGRGDNRQLLHPLIPSFSYITTLLSSFADGGDADDKLLVARMTLPQNVGGIEIKFIGGMVIEPAVQTGIKPFTVYATSSYGSRDGEVKRYDCVQVTNEGMEGEPNEMNIYDEVITYPFSQVSDVSIYAYISLCSVMSDVCLSLNFVYVCLCLLMLSFYYYIYFCLFLLMALFSGIEYSSRYRSSS
jgi:hypothetical protein